MDFKNYDDATLDTIINRPREICKDPYKLLTSFLVNSVFELAENEDSDEHTYPWGQKVPTKILDNYIKDCISDFLQASKNDTTVKIKGQGFTVWKSNTLHPQNIFKIISFKKDGDDYIISKDGIYNIKSDFLEDFDSRREEYDNDRTYFRKVMAMAYDDKNNGWDRLTDMECLMYAWATSLKKVPMSKRVNEEWVREWCLKSLDKYGLDIKTRDVLECFRENVEDSENLSTMFPFSMKKVLIWNDKNNQVTPTSEISDKEADDFWFDVLKKKYTRMI